MGLPQAGPKGRHVATVDQFLYECPIPPVFIEEHPVMLEVSIPVTVDGLDCHLVFVQDTDS
jgi:hypothetical protein